MSMYLGDVANAIKTLAAAIRTTNRQYEFIKWDTTNGDGQCILRLNTQNGRIDRLDPHTLEVIKRSELA